ncbi:testicular acid phosphatase homolog [Pseudomyrmex gracilis]|uniref:testicular acid phosphatase homolog n=1 Tax=Pseudomyrmex gracilis TaxID=219809 RepID=UPI000995D4D2|nr:testicular acid phosphatase homolog [Pseudomyrmex gracilis]
MKHRVLYTFLFLLNLFVFSECNFQVELVQVLMRHGERTPSLDEIKMYPNDRYNVSTYEPWGLGQLTNQGKHTEYQLGQILRQRYDKLLGSIYYPEDIYAFSTNIDRTKTSLNLMLAGLYPPTSVQMWNPNLAWFPIPTHYAPMESNNLLKYFVCPKYNAILKDVFGSQEVLDKIAAYTDFFNFLSNKTGTNVTNLSNVKAIYQLLTAQKAMNLTMPEWYNDKIDQQLENCFALLCDIQSYTTELKRFNGELIISAG